LIFVTSIARDALSTNIADYNSFVHGIANGPTSEFQSLGTTWFAFASTEARHQSRLFASTGPLLPAEPPISGTAQS